VESGTPVPLEKGIVISKERKTNDSSDRVTSPSRRVRIDARRPPAPVTSVTRCVPSRSGRRGPGRYHVAWALDGGIVGRFRRALTTGVVSARRVLRREVDLPSRYSVEGNRVSSWHECHVVDISRGGAGIFEQEGTAAELTGVRIVLELAIEPALLRVRGQVRHARPTDGGGVQFGVQFDALTALEADLLDAMVNHARAL
jgi:hypothetical protein